MIGIFDSGIGGLTVMKKYLKKYPQYDYLYLGDQANVPYGNKSKEFINKLVFKNIDFLVKKGCKLIIIACNTASASSLQLLQSKYKGNPVILGVLVPAVEEALESSRFGKISVIATSSTIESKAYSKELEKYKDIYLNRKKDKRANTKLQINEKACPLLAPFIEEGIFKGTMINMLLKNYLRPLKHCHTDTLILGCTHYLIIEKDIKRIIGKRVKVLSSSQASVNAIESYFKKHKELEKSLSKNKTRTYLTTNSKEKFDKLASKILKEKIESEKINLE